VQSTQWDNLKNHTIRASNQSVPELFVIYAMYSLHDIYKLELYNIFHILLTIPHTLLKTDP